MKAKTAHLFKHEHLFHYSKVSLTQGFVIDMVLVLSIFRTLLN